MSLLSRELSHKEPHSPHYKSFYGVLPLLRSLSYLAFFTVDIPHSNNRR